MKQGCDRQKFDKVTVIFVLFFVSMAVCYGWRLFALTPWYDELYTYYYFISRGPVYAAIHWPLPNNHIGYSVLSACLNVFGNSHIALRGISYLSSMGSLLLLFAISRKCFERWLALVPVFLYAGMKLVNQLSVQGRGYAFVTLCYLTAVYELIQITVEHRGRVRDDLLFGLSLTGALYAIPSSAYVVIPVCLTGGLFLLMQGEYGRLVRLILTSMISAVCTAGLYGIVWLAIGSNLLVKTEGSAFYGMGHTAVILQEPFTALKTGIEYMLATPYIQSVGRQGFLEKFTAWLRNLLNEYYTGGAAILAAGLVLCMFGTLYQIIRKVQDGGYRRKVERPDYSGFMAVYLAVGILSIPLLLIMLSSLPYYRVFSFAGVILAFAAVWLMERLIRGLKDKVSEKTGHSSESCRRIWQYLPGAVAALCGILCAALLLSPAYRAQYSGREAAIEDAYAQIEWPEVDKVAVTDCDQEYLLLFLYGIDEKRIAGTPEEADAVLADKYLLLGNSEEAPEATGDRWKLYTTPEEFARFVEAAGLTPVYENERFVVFQ